MNMYMIRLWPGPCPMPCPLCIELQKTTENGRAVDTFWLESHQKPFVFLEIRFRPMHTMSGLP